MAITVGARPEASFLDPVGMLTDCHRRVLRFLGDLMSVSATFAGEVLPPLERQRLANALRYFREAAPHHTADEEESLFPRLRAVPDHPALRDALDLVESLERDHATAAPLHEEVDRMAGRWLEGGTLSEFDVGRLRAATATMLALYREHIAAEEAQLFPIARKVLDADALRACGREMAARRGIDFDAWQANVALLGH